MLSDGNVQQLLEEALIVATRPAAHDALHLDVFSRQGLETETGQRRSIGIDVQRRPVDGGAEQHGVQLQVILDVGFLLALLHLVKRRLRDVDMAALDEDRHLAIEECQQQRSYVRAINVGIRVVAAQATHARR